MLATQDVIDTLAVRIERAYRLRRPHWHGGCSTPRVWAAAVRVLLELHEGDPSIPVDPELYVAAQSNDEPFPDPWRELTGGEPAARYRGRVRTIVRALRSALSGEVTRAEQVIGSGQAVDRVLGASGSRLSPLGRFIVAHRAGRPALVRRFAGEAAEQYLACPLYREACRRLLPLDAYPIAEPEGAAKAYPNPPVYQAHAPIHRN